MYLEKIEQIVEAFDDTNKKQLTEDLEKELLNITNYGAELIDNACKLSLGVHVKKTNKKRLAIQAKEHLNKTARKYIGKNLVDPSMEIGAFVLTYMDESYKAARAL